MHRDRPVTDPVHRARSETAAHDHRCPLETLAQIAQAPAPRARPDVAAEEQARSELRYWKCKRAETGRLANEFYEWLYTTYFGLPWDFYADKRVLDIGCGPRGSLEWADMARERVGVDPMADQYRELGTDAHAMRYVTAGAERIPLPDQHFEVVAAFNSLDHVEDVDRAIREIKRLITPSGLFLLIVEVNHPPTNTEPLTLQWDIIDRFRDCFELIEQRSYEVGEHRLYRQLRRGVLYDHTDPSERPALITAKFRKLERPHAAP